MNALAHCAEALYVHGHNPDADEPMRSPAHG